MKQKVVIFALLLSLGSIAGCEMLKSKVCAPQGSALTSRSGNPELGGAESSGPETPRFLYTRVRYFQNPTVRKDEVPVLHMCWYVAETAVAFETPSEFEIAIQTDPGVAKVSSLYEFFTPASELAAKLQEQNASNAADLDKSGISQLTLVLGDMDRMALGLGNLIHSAPARTLHPAIVPARV